MPRKSSAAVAFTPSTATRLHPPEDLVGEARKVFVDLVLACRAEHFQDSDAAVLAVYCRAIVQERVASAGLKADGYVTADGKPSGWLPILQAATRVISTYSRMLRLNPAARASAPATEPEPMSYYAKQRLLEARDDDDAAN